MTRFEVDQFCFDLELLDFCSAWKGKLVVKWEGGERSWSRWAGDYAFPIHAILEDSLLDPPIPDWKEVDLSWEDLRVLPNRLRQALSHWRGIYFIFDIADGKGYVGSAYGDENLLGRWRNYAARGDGGNRLLIGRNENDFRFSILQLMAPNAELAEVIALENSWKNRLRTREAFGGLNLN